MASSARIDELQRKFEENPRRYFAPLANEYRRSGHLDRAVAICREQLAKQPNHMSGQIVLGQALYESGARDDARALFQTALDLDPENVIALRHMGDIARAAGQLDDARRWYTRVLDADPRNPEVTALIGTLDLLAPAASAAQQPAPAPAFVDAPPAIAVAALHAPGYLDAIEAAQPPAPADAAEVDADDRDRQADGQGAAAATDEPLTVVPEETFEPVWPFAEEAREPVGEAGGVTAPLAAREDDEPLEIVARGDALIGEVDEPLTMAVDEPAAGFGEAEAGSFVDDAPRHDWTTGSDDVAPITRLGGDEAFGEPAPAVDPYAPAEPVLEIVPAPDFDAWHDALPPAEPYGANAEPSAAADAPEVVADLPYSSEPELAEPALVEPALVQSNSVEPELVEPELVDAALVEPELDAPEPAESELRVGRADDSIARADDEAAAAALSDESDTDLSELVAPAPAVAAVAGGGGASDEIVLPIEAYGYEEAAPVAEAALLPSIDEFSYDEPAEREAELPSIAAFAYDEPALPTYEEPGPAPVAATADAELPSIEAFAYDAPVETASAPTADVGEPEVVVPAVVDAEPFAGAGFEAPVIEAEAAEPVEVEALASAAVEEPAAPFADEAAGPAAPLPEPAIPSGSPFVTETMAELYLRQGFREEALGVYRQLLASDPYNQALSEKVRALTGDFEAVDATAPASPTAATPASAPVVTARGFFAALAARRPGGAERAAAAAAQPERAPAPRASEADEHEPALEIAPAAGTGFAIGELDAFVEPEEDARAVPPAVALLPIEAYRYDDAPETAAEAAGAGASTLDALFGNAPVRADDAAAATMLATAFGDVPAEGERGATAVGAAPAGPSLDEIFRAGAVEPPPPRRVTPTAFSFDQFFTDDPPPPAAPSAGAAPGPPPPARLGEESPGDLDTFNSWLEGLKRK